MSEIKPQPGPQTDFLSSPVDIAIYGGAAGGGKTFALLMEPLRHIHNKQFGTVILRRLLTSIKTEGGMWDESQNLYTHLGGGMRSGDLSWVFPSGAKITFSGIEHEKDLKKYQGSQINLIEFDQLEEFTERMFFFMFSRNRSVSGIRPYIRATANPEPGWLAEFLSWWIADDGYADMDRAGMVRWFVRTGDRMVWADTCEELEDAFPNTLPKSVTFIPASVYDNKILMEKDPGYLSNLQALAPVERARLLGDARRGGNWKIKPAAGNLYNRSWYPLVDVLPAGGIDCLYWDLAGTERELKGTSASGGPSYTAGVAIRKKNNVYTVHHVVAAQVGPAEVERMFVNVSRQMASQAREHGAQFKVRWEVEPGSAGKREAMRLTRLLDGIDAKGSRVHGDKFLRGRPFASQSEAGNVSVYRAAWTEQFLEHLHNQPDIPENDIHDAAVGAYNELAGGQKAQAAVVDWDAPVAGAGAAAVEYRTPEEVEKLVEEAGYEL